MQANHWTTPADLKAQLQKLWNRGELLRDALSERSIFPLRLSIRRPNARELAEQLPAVRDWAQTFGAIPVGRIEWQTIDNRVQGKQRIPAALWLDSIDEALLWLNLKSEFRQFSQLLSETQTQCPEVIPWLAKRPLQALNLASVWKQILAVLQWMQHHPQPQIYLRQVSIPGVDTKFIEQHRSVLSELFDRVLPAAQIDLDKTGIGQFNARYGFVDKPLRIRIRALDPTLLGNLNGTDQQQSEIPDISFDLTSFQRLNLGAQRILITENEINFLTLPALNSTLAIFGSGYGWEALGSVAWLTDCEIFYWGDIDTHGFAILDQLRRYFPQTRSILMDRETLEAHQTAWGTEKVQSSASLSRLTPAEQALYQALRNQEIQSNLRLEQELIRYDWVTDALSHI